MGCACHIGYSHLHAHTHCHTVDTLGESTLERHLHSSEISVGIMRSPDGGFIVHGIRIGQIGIQTAVARCEPLVHGLGIDKELEGGSRLAHSGHLIIFPRFEINVSHPSLHLSRIWFDGHESAMHKLHHIAYGVHRAQILLHHSVIAEHLYRVRQIEIIVHRIGAVGKAFLQIFIMCGALCDILYEVRYLIMLPIPPWRHVPPVVVKPLLYDLHMFLDSLLGILLHPAVQGGIHGESVSIEVQFVVGIISWYKCVFQ